MAELKRIISLCSVFLLVFFLGCEEPPPKYPSGGPYFYRSYNGYYLPFRPTEEITFGQLQEIEEQGGAYCIAYFDRDGRITKFMKYDNGKLEFEDRYYYEERIIRRELTRADGSNTFGIIDKEGRYISGKKE